MKKIIIFCFFIIFAVSGFASKLDINIIYEASRMKVKETTCGTMPTDLSGYIETEEGCFQMQYELEVPMYGFTYVPKTPPADEPTKLAYYISFFDSAFPRKDLVKTEVIENGKPVRELENFVHERTFQGLVVLEKGQSIRMSTEEEPSYIIVYAIFSAIVAAGLFFIIRKKK